MTLKVLYIGDDRGGSYLRADALRRLGHRVHLINPHFSGPLRRVIGKWMYETGGLGIGPLVHRFVVSKVGDERFDLVFVNGGNMVGPSLVQYLQQRGSVVVNYNNDDPFGTRDRKNWQLYLRTVPYYDLLVVVRQVNVPEAYALGAKNVLRVFMSANEILHAPRVLTPSDVASWQTDVACIATWMPERGPFLAALLNAGLPIGIYGNDWHKAPEWPILRRAWRGNAIYGDDYAKAIQSAKVCLGLLSKGNRDLHTIRSAEIPSLGGLLCAERTSEHLGLYLEDEEAVFWADADECIMKCQELLADETRRKRIAAKGRERSLRNGLFDQRIMETILSHALR